MVIPGNDAANENRAPMSTTSVLCKRTTLSQWYEALKWGCVYVLC